MTSDESDAITSYKLDHDADDDDDLPPRSYWWSLHRPETYAIAALTFALGTLLSFGASEEIAQAIVFSVRSANSEHILLYTLAGIRLGGALLAIGTAALSIRSEDDETTWSPPVARAAILVAALSALLSVAALITIATASTPGDNTGF
jgi:hypothetical protein